MGELRQKPEPICGADCPEWHTPTWFSKHERRIDIQQLTGLEHPSLRSETFERLQCEISDWIRARRRIESCEVDLKRFEFAGLGIESLYHAFSKNELISERVFSKRNISDVHRREKPVNRLRTIPSRSQRMPPWFMTGAANVKPTVVRHIAVRLSKQVG
jgi:hypothetical protein